MPDQRAEFSLDGRRVWVAGHRGMVGSAVVRRLRQECCEILTADRQTVDLRRQADVERWMQANRPDVVVVAAATVGGILANDTRPAEFLFDNVAIQTNIIHAAYRHEVKKLLFLGSSCIYPRLAPQPIPEQALLSGPLESTNQWYAIAKIAGLMMCQAYRRQYGCDYISAMPCNLYGVGDNFDLTSSHVAPALLAKIHHAKISGTRHVKIWGSGKPQREFLYVDDCADALVFLLRRYSGEGHINVGAGTDITIAELARTIACVVGFEGEFLFDSSKPDGTPRKLMDSTTIHQMGWKSTTTLEQGLRKTYEWYVAHEANK